MKRLVVVTLGAALMLLAVGARTVRAQSGDEARLLVAEARDAIEDREFKRAGRLLDRAIEINPRRVDAYVLRSTVFAVFKQYDRGIALLRRAQRLAPGNVDVLNALGSQLVLAGQDEEGVPILEGVVVKQPKRYEAHALLAHHYVRTASWERAETALEAYLATRPKRLAKRDSVHYIDLGDAKLRLGKTKRALGLFDRVLSDDDDNVRARMGRAWALAAMDCRKAMPVFSKLSGLGETYPEIWLVWGHCALKVDQLDRAVDLASRYTKRRPKSAGGYALLGGAYASRGDVNDARKSLQHAIEIEPDQHVYVIKLARLDRQAGEPRVAAARLATSKRPADDDLLWLAWHIEWGESLIDAGKHDEAVELARRVVTARPGAPAAQYMLGDALRRTHSYPKSIEALEAAIRLDGDFTRAEELLVEVLNDYSEQHMAANDLTNAEAVLVRAEAVGPSSRTWSNLALVRIKRGDHKGALEPLEKLQDRDVRSAHMHGHVLGVVGELEASERVLGKAMELAGKDPAAQQAIAIDLAATQVAANAPDRAVDVLKPLLDKPGDAIAQAYVIASRAHATSEMLAGHYGTAIRTLGAARDQVARDDDATRTAIDCDLGLALTAARQRTKATSVLRSLARDKAVCPFPAPADKLAVPILLAVNEGMDSRLAARSLRTLAGLRKAASGVAKNLLEEAIGIVAMRSAAAAHARGRTSSARKFMNAAAKVVSARDAHLRHNLAVLDIEAGKFDTAIAALTRVVDDVPEALINLGIAYDRKGDAASAVRQWRRAVARSKSAEVEEWIANKEYVYGAEIGR